jgi:hypothetical protein
LEPIDFDLPTNSPDWWIFDPKDCTPDVVWPLETGTIVEKSDGMLLHRARSVSTKEVRGIVTKFSPFMVRTDVAVHLHDKTFTGAGIYAYIGGKWANADGHRRSFGTPFAQEAEATLDGDAEIPRFMTSIALRQRYEWAVALGLENSPSIRFSTDPTGIKEVFRIRDLPEGKDRREALLTWVSDNWREDRFDPEVETYVRKHLRGAVQFSWNGLSGEVIPAQFDLEQRDILIAKRAAMKAGGTDKRRRLP